MAITERENEQIKEANAATGTTVVFIHGLWLLPSSWDAWRQRFAEAGFATPRRLKRRGRILRSLPRRPSGRSLIMSNRWSRG